MEMEQTVEIPKNNGKITLKKQGDCTYVEYTYDRVYKADKKYNIPKRKTIGKVCKDDPDRMHPNKNFTVFFPDTEIPEEEHAPKRSGCLRMGSYAVIKRVIEGYHLDKMLETIIGKKSGLFLDIAAYTIVSEDNSAQHYPDYAYNHPLMTEGMEVYSDSTVGDFLKSISVDQRIQFINAWNEKRDRKEKIYISYDSTNKDVQAGDIEEAEPGHAKDGKNFPVINYSIAYDRMNRIPLFYEDYPGSVVDVTQLQCMLEKAKSLGYTNCGFILDRGYFSKGNIHYMDRNGYEFIMMVKGRKSLVRQIIDKNRRTFEDKWENHISPFNVYGITVEDKLFDDDTGSRYFHLYFSSAKYAQELSEIEHRIEKARVALEKTCSKAKNMDPGYLRYFRPVYDNEGQEDQVLSGFEERADVINEELKYCGYFCIVTSKEMTAKDAITIYKSRDASEKLFRMDKSFMDNATLGVQSSEGAEAKIFIEFVALVIRNKIYTNLLDEVGKIETRPNYMNVTSAISELEKIEMIRMGNGCYSLDHAVTKTEKTILKAFGMDAASIQREASRISKVLQEN